MAVILVAFILAFTGKWDKTSLAVGKDVENEVIKVIHLNVPRYTGNSSLKYTVDWLIAVGFTSLFLIYLSIITLVGVSFTGCWIGKLNTRSMHMWSLCTMVYTGQYLSRRSHMLLPGNMRTRPDFGPGCVSL